MAEGEEPRRDRRRLVEYKKVLCIILILFSLAGIILIASLVFGCDHSKVEDKRNKNIANDEAETIPTTTTPKIVPTYSPMDELINISRICSSPNCFAEVSRLLSRIDTTKDPCQDFYSYSCGRAERRTKPKDYIWSKLLKQIQDIDDGNEEFLTKYKNYFKSCVAHERDLSYERKFDEILKFAKENKITVGLSNARFDLDVEEILAILISIKGAHFMDIGPTIRDPIFKLSLPQNLETEDMSDGLWRNQKKCLNQQLYNFDKSPLNYTAIHETYERCTRNSTEFHDLFDSSFKNYLPGNYKAQIDGILKFYPPSAQINEMILNLKYKTFRVGEIKEIYPIFNWTKLFINLFEEDLNNTELVEVYFDEYFSQLSGELANSNSNMKELFSHILLNVLNYNFAIPRKIKDVETHCVKATVSSFKDVASFLYLVNSGLEDYDEMRVVTEVFEIFKSSLRETFNSSRYRSYLGSSSSDVIEEIRVVFESKGDVEELRQKYSELKIGASYMRNTLAVGKLQMKNLLRRSSTTIFGNFVNSFDKYPTSFYGKYDIYVPKRYLETLITSQPAYLLYPKVYFHLAKAFAKLFDPFGVREFISFDQLGSYRRTFAKSYLENSTEYSHINQDLSKNELIIENAATRLITDAFHVDYLNYNIFSNTSMVMFVALAQEYCENLDPLSFMLRLRESDKLPGELRVKNIVGNSKDFDVAFNCAAKLVGKEYFQFPHFLYELQ